MPESLPFVSRYAGSITASGWSLPSYMTGAPNNQFSTRSIAAGATASGQLRAYNFGFTANDFPSGAVIAAISFWGIEKGSIGNYFRAFNVRGVTSGAVDIGELQDQGYCFLVPVTEEWIAGWGNTIDPPYANSVPYLDLPVSAVIGSGFGFYASYKNMHSTSSVTGSIDALRARVTWRYPKTKDLYVKHNGIWKAVDTNYVRQNGVWKDGQQWVKHNGIWKKVYGT